MTRPLLFQTRPLAASAALEPSAATVAVQHAFSAVQHAFGAVQHAFSTRSAPDLSLIFTRELSVFKGLHAQTAKNHRFRFLRRSRRPHRGLFSGLADSWHGKIIAQSLAFRKKLHAVWKRASPLPQLAGEGGAKRRMGCGPPLRRKPVCTTDTPVFVRPYLLSPPHPAFAPLPRFAGKGGAALTDARCDGPRRRPRACPGPHRTPGSDWPPRSPRRPRRSPCRVAAVPSRRSRRR